VRATSGQGSNLIKVSRSVRSRASRVDHLSETLRPISTKLVELVGVALIEQATCLLELDEAVLLI
jgi:hypothetical protein